MNVKCETERRAREECRRARPGGGFTLVELLVVLAVIAIMAGVAIPAFSRMGLFSRNELQRASRELFTVIRAARVFAATYNVNTAVIYGECWDGLDEDRPDADCFRSIGVVYQITDEKGTKSYVPVMGEEGGFRRLPGDTCVAFVKRDVTGEPLTARADAGVSPPIKKDKDEADPNTEIGVSFEYQKGDLLPPYEEQDGYWGHVFRPSGQMLNSSPELFRVYVQFTPDAPESERVYQDANGKDHLQMRTIKLYRATGRSEIASGEDEKDR